jgi:hypothetical protein
MAASFTTHTGLVIELKLGADGEPSTVTITGANTKPLHKGTELTAARAYKYAVEHYQQREIASQLEPSQEGEVRWFNPNEGA